ncbi:MAG: hypothetical protein IJ632_05905 [Muribaculaceae bacterium]|nr:hypothetical protein [Muribaculaceae bacterium]
MMILLRQSPISWVRRAQQGQQGQYKPRGKSASGLFGSVSATALIKALTMAELKIIGAFPLPIINYFVLLRVYLAKSPVL